jgi:preprotein translocase subunit SecB
MLAQVNFDALYAQKVQQVMEQQKAEQGEAEAAE